MYNRTAAFYDAMYYSKNYKVESDLLISYIRKHTPHAENLLEIACGTGKYLEYLKEYFEVEGLDIDEELLKVAKTRNSNIIYHHQNMVNFSLPFSYDVVVCLFSSIAYVQTVENLYKAVEGMVKHLNPKGFIAVEPWIAPKDYWVGKLTSNYTDLPDLKLSWMYISQLEERTSIFNIHYMAGTREGISTFTEQHVLGLWTDEEYREAFKNAGIEVKYDAAGLCGRGMYYGTKE